jgi:hypothetical protein
LHRHNHDVGPVTEDMSFLRNMDPPRGEFLRIIDPPILTIMDQGRGWFLTNMDPSGASFS